jgi:prepilin-type N-terminal cleavage/methylation domain-containing protein
MKRGFTLIELLVYMAIMGFIIVVAGRVFSDSTVMRVRSQNMIKTAEEVGKIANLIKEDISQMGAKAWGKDEGGSEGYKIYDANSVVDDASTTTKANVKAVADVYMSKSGTNPFDSSSFELYRDYVTSKAAPNIKFDSLVFRKAEFKPDNGDFLGVREITWYVDTGHRLFRLCRTIEGIGDDDICPKKDKPEEAKRVLIADSIKTFSFFLSKPGVSPSVTGTTPSLDIQKDIVFPEPNQKSFQLVSLNDAENIKKVYPSPPIGEDDPIVSIKDFAKNDNSNEKKFSQVYFYHHDNGSCYNIPIQEGETYIVEFNMPFPKSEVEMAKIDENNDEELGGASSGQFLPGEDHIAIGLREGNSDKKIPGISPDVLLYAPQSHEANNNSRYAEFTANDRFDPSKTKIICVALTFSFYSQLASDGELRFRNFKIHKKPTGSYHFVKKTDDNPYDEDEAKKYATENDDSNEKFSRKRNVKAIELLLEISRNGEVAGTNSKGTTGMAIPVPNNGATSL